MESSQAGNKIGGDRDGDGFQNVGSSRQSDQEEEGWEEGNGSRRRRRQPKTPPQKEPFMLILVGLPGSGKSTIARTMCDAMPHTYVRVNQDQLGNRRACEDLARDTLKGGRSAIIDRCNFDGRQRSHFFDIAREARVAVDGIVLMPPPELCVRRCEERQHHETVSPREAKEIVMRMYSQFQTPSKEREPFRRLHFVTHMRMIDELLASYLTPDQDVRRSDVR